MARLLILTNLPTEETEMTGRINDKLVNFDGWYVVALNQISESQKNDDLESILQFQDKIFDLYPRVNNLYFCHDFQGKNCYRYICTAARAIKRIKLGKSYEPRWDVSQWDGLCRLPNIGMIEIAIHFLIIKPDRSSSSSCMVVGASPEAEQAAIAAKIPYLELSEFCV